MIHYQERTQRTLLSPAVGFRFLIVAAAFPAIILQQQHGRKLLSASGGGGGGLAAGPRDRPPPLAPTTLSDQMAVATLAFASTTAAVSALVAHLMHGWVHADPSSRREQDFNRRVFLLVGLIDGLMTSAVPLAYLAILQYLIVLACFGQASHAFAPRPAVEESAAAAARLVSLAVLTLALAFSCLLLARATSRYFSSKMADLRRQFKLFDTDGSGGLSVDELLVALSNYGYHDYEQAIIMLHLLGPNWVPQRVPSSQAGSGGPEERAVEASVSEREVSEQRFVEVMGSPLLAFKMAMQHGSAAQAKGALHMLHAARELRAEATASAMQARSAGGNGGEEPGGLRVLPPVLLSLPQSQLEALEMHLRLKRAARQVAGDVLQEAGDRLLQASAQMEVLQELSGGHAGATGRHAQTSASLSARTKGPWLPTLKVPGEGVGDGKGWRGVSEAGSPIRHKAVLQGGTAAEAVSRFSVLPSHASPHRRPVPLKEDVDSSVVDALLQEGREAATGGREGSGRRVGAATTWGSPAGAAGTQGLPLLRGTQHRKDDSCGADGREDSLDDNSETDTDLSDVSTGSEKDC